MLRIKNGTVIDGTGKPGYKADIITSGDRIAAIGHFPKNNTIETIDALGCIVTPGFIDVNTDSDHQLTLFTNPEQQDFIKQGVTTIIGGLCGASLAPLIDGKLDSIRKWADINVVNTHWQRLKELQEILEHQKLGVNFGTLIGYSTIRRAITHGKHRDLTDQELNMMSSVIRDALRDGALGLSTGLDFAHARLVPHKEIYELTKIIASHGKIYATHLRDDHDKFEHAIKETLSIAKTHGLKTIINHLRIYKRYEEKIYQGLKYIRTHWEKLHCRVDITPCTTYTFPIYQLLPAWASVDCIETMLQLLRSRAHHEELKKNYTHLNVDALQIVNAPHHFLIGKTVKEFATNRGLDAGDGLLELMINTNLRAQLSYNDVNEEEQSKLIDEPWTCIGSNTASRVPLDDAIASAQICPAFQKFLQREKIIKKPIEQSIQKITHTPATFFNIKNRGMIKEGYYADLVIMQNDEVDYVLINGKVALRHKRLSVLRCGAVLKE